MATKFAQFLTDNGIDPRRVLVASRTVERLRPDDRRIRLALKRARSEEGSSEKKPETKPRSGRPVTPRLLRDASEEGKRIPAPAKQRLLRAVNRILEQKTKDPVELRTLF